MLWRRRSSSISDDTTVDLDKIEQLNSRFRLRIPKSLKSKIITKEIFLHSDGSTCSTRSSKSNQTAKNTGTGKHVHFSDKVVVFLPSLNIPTDTEAEAIWFSSTEITNMKNGLKNIWKGSHISDQDFVAAVDLVQLLFADQVDLSEVTETLDETSLDDSQIKQIKIYKDCARILSRNHGRGLERMYYGKSTFSKLGAKSLHVQRFVRSVLAVQERLKDSTIDSRSDAIAAQCQTLPSIWWARIVAELDAESSQSDAMPYPTNIFEHTQIIESLEV